MANQPADQQKLVKLVNKFRGISQYKNIAGIGMESAIDLLNVMPSNIGNLEKLRVPVVRGPVASAQPHIDTMFYFSQGVGTRQMFVNAGQYIGYYVDPETGALWAYTQIGLPNPSYNSRMYYVNSNNLLFAANGIIQFKWDGANQTAWGIAQPPTAQLGIQLPITSIQRSGGGVITLIFSVAALPVASGTGNPVNGVSAQQFANAPVVGDSVNIVGVAGDATLDGNFVVATGPVNAGADLFSITLTATGGASGPFLNQGTITIYGGSCGPFNITQVQRTNNLTTITFVGSGTILPGEQMVVAGLIAPWISMNGTWTVASLSALGFPQFNQIGPDVPAVGVVNGTAAGGFTNLLTPRTWRIGWADTVVGHEGPSSANQSMSVYLNGGLVSNYRAYITVTLPGPLNGFSQSVSGIYLYANQDGAGLWVLENPFDAAYTVVPNNGTAVVIGDAMADGIMDATQQANFINFPPPIGIKNLVRWQGRIFGAIGQNCLFSGYDQILRGRPEESFPPLNIIKLAIGADNIRGLGVLMNGVVLWDQSNKMYLFEGTIEDIIATQPVLLTAYLADEPWQVGLSSGLSVQSTPRGVIWVASDLTVQIWNGIFYGELIGPRDLSVNIYPLMNRITPSTKAFIQSAFFNWIDRDWYAILVCLDGATIPNYLIFFDLSQEGADNLGIWLANVQADSICVKEDSTGVRHLIISQGGAPYELSVASTSITGIHKAPTQTSSELIAYWTSGFWQDSPHMMKMYRYGRLTTDQDGFQLVTTVINDETSRLRDSQPWQKILKMTPGGRFATNRKGRRQNFDIIFPQQDMDASVLELYTTAIALSEI